MTVISAETRSTHQWIYNWVDYGSSLYVCANTVNISCSTVEHYEVLSNFHPAWVIGPNSSRRWRNDGVGKVMQDYTRLPFTLDEFLNFFFRPMSVVAGSHLYLTCLKKKGQMTNDRRVTLSNINCLKKAISAHWTATKIMVGSCCYFSSSFILISEITTQSICTLG